jgi:phage portal protein BeeE
MEPRWTSPTEYVSYYDYKVDGQTTQIDAKDVVHLRNGIDPRNTRKGLSQIKSVIREIYSDNMATQYSAAMLSNYGTPGMILSPVNAEQSYTPDQAAVIKQSVIEKTTGDRRGEPVIFLDPVKVDIPTFAPNQMNVRESQYTPEERVSAVIGVPAIVVGLGAGLNRSTFSNTDQAYEMAYRSFLIPVQRLIAADLTTQLLPDFSDDPAERAEYDYNEIRALQPDRMDVAKYSVMIFQGGIADRAEMRAELNLKVRPEDKGVFYLPRGGSYSDGSIAEPVVPQTTRVLTEPGTQTPPPNGHSAEPVPAATG